MSGKKIVRYALAILASWAVMWFARHRLPEPLIQGLAFWVMFLLLPLSLSDKAADKKLTWTRHVLAATAGGAIVLLLNILVGGWQAK